MMVWSDAMDARLRELATTQMMYRDIAATLSREFSKRVTKNSCIGRANRIGVVKRFRKPAKKRKPRREPALPPLPIDGPYVPPPKPVFRAPPKLKQLRPVWGDAPKTCQYIAGEPMTPMCGEPSLSGLPYCNDHAALCYRAPYDWEKRQ